MYEDRKLEKKKKLENFRFVWQQITPPTLAKEVLLVTFLPIPKNVMHAGAAMCRS